MSAAPHPAERRRMARVTPPAAPHAAQLRPLGADGAGAVIATAEGRDFIAGLMTSLGAEDWRARVAAMQGRRRGGDGVLELNLPIHNRFQIALYEAVCPRPGYPRLDPAQIASQGLVIRRRDGARWAAWRRAGGRISGWAPLVQGDADPDAARGAAVHAANAAIRAQIARQNPRAATDEEVVPLFLAPPAVCAARGRTILFAVIPTVCGERPDAPPPALDYAALPPAQDAAMRAHLSVYFKQHGAFAMPRAGQALDPDWNVLNDTAAPSAEDERLRRLGVFLHQLLAEMDVLGAGPAPAALRNALREVRMPLRRDAQGRVDGTIDAASFVAAAAPVLIGGEPNAGGVAMPAEWPDVGAALGGRLTRAALDCLSARHRALAQPAGKYDAADDRYAVRAFIRVRGHADCPERIVWSDYSEPFRILPWWDGDGPGTKITMPDLSQMKRARPGVTFDLPPAIANLMQKNMKKLSDGEGSRSDTGGPDVGWLCSFSIPIVTLCAFIVLNIFLSLLDIVFRWKMFIKVCIPIPKR